MSHPRGPRETRLAQRLATSRRCPCPVTLGAHLRLRLNPSIFCVHVQTHTYTLHVIHPLILLIHRKTKFKIFYLNVRSFCNPAVGGGLLCLLGSVLGAVTLSGLH